MALLCVAHLLHHHINATCAEIQTIIAEYKLLTHWGRVTHICVGKQTNIGSDNGLSPGRRQAIIWTNAGILLIGPLGTNFSEISIKILTFSFTKMRLKVSSAKWRPFCLGLNVLRNPKWAITEAADVTAFKWPTRFGQNLAAPQGIRYYRRLGTRPNN